MKIQSNIKIISTDLKNNFKKLQDPEYLLREIAFDVVDMMTKRIHIDGIASDGGRIGDYSAGYMKVRTGDFGNSGTFTKGSKKGQTKNSGVFSRGLHKGEPRPKYNRNSDTKIIVSLTRQLENDWSVIPVEKGYGIGFLNPFNLQKARWVEEGQNKKIFDLTDTESQYVEDQINKRVNDALSGKA